MSLFSRHYLLRGHLPHATLSPIPITGVPLREPRWCAAKAKYAQLPKKLRSWLLARDSLTSKLVKAAEGDFRVELLSQKVARVYASEAHLLGLKNNRQALVREVILYGKQQPWVFARSVMPLTTLTGRLRALRKLDNRPMGHHLFSYPYMRRSAIEIASIGAAQDYLPKSLRPLTAAIQSPLWGRRSVFHLDNKPLLVSEVFLGTFRPGHT